MALSEWGERVRLGLDEKRVSVTTVFMKHGADENPMAIGTYSELLDRLPRTLQLLEQTVIVNAVAGFEAYVGEVCSEFLTACQPISGVAEEGSVEHHRLAKELERSGRTIAKVKALSKLVGIDLNHRPEGVDVDMVAEIIETRNLLVHSSGVVDDVYLKHVPQSDLEAAQRRPITPIYLKDSLFAIDALEIFIDGKVAARIVERTGKTLPEYPEYGFGKRPKTRPSAADV